MDLNEFFPELDSERALSSIKSFVTSTGVNCVMIDSSGRVIFSFDSDGSYEKVYQCKFCELIHEKTNSRCDCLTSHLYGSYQARRFGGKYIYFCPMGMAHFASSVTVGEANISCIGGPLLIIDRDEYITQDLINKYNLPHDLYETFYSMLKNIEVTTEKLSSYSELLYMTCAYIGGISSIHIINEENTKQQGQINEYIQALKKRVSENAMPSYPIDKEKEFLSAVAAGDKPNSRRLLNEILGYIYFSSGREFDIIKARVLELIVMLSRAVIESGADAEQIFGMNYRYLNELNELKNLDEISFWLSQIMTRFTDYVFNFTNVKHIDVIYKAVEFIKQHYTEKITLDDAANHVYLSAPYFSKIFKEEMNCNFNAYLNKFRIEQSKKLLLTNADLTEISVTLGFGDQSYFSKVFKKITGITPGKYREIRGMMK